MSETVIKVEHLGKQYRLGQVGTGTITHDLNRWWHKIRGKEDPYLKLGDANDRTKKGDSDLVWALKDVNFEVKKGEVLGIIGRNGAGKSTLLKILSRVTGPTVGDIKVKGRIASLLEVGTGFHPDLSGRENIFLNGAILGMTKAEIKEKFDEIVAFSGVERYIDTPVKRYSSGMYVRLAFAVAAHLEPEILIVDEVLAVGDAEFQKKCLGKMQDVASHGRTVLFVSHNMSAVNSLCNKTALMHQGTLLTLGPTLPVIEKYLELCTNRDEQGNADPYFVPKDWERPWGQRDARITRVELFNSKNELTTEVAFLEKIKIRITFDCSAPIRNSILQIRTATITGQQVSLSHSKNDTGKLMDFDTGLHEVEMSMPLNLMPGTYSFFIYLVNEEGTLFYDGIPNFLKFQIKNMAEGSAHYLSTKINTFIYQPGEWNIKK